MTQTKIRSYRVEKSSSKNRIIQAESFRIWVSTSKFETANVSKINVQKAVFSTERDFNVQSCMIKKIYMIFNSNLAEVHIVTELGFICLISKIVFEDSW